MRMASTFEYLRVPDKHCLQHAIKAWSLATRASSGMSSHCTPLRTYSWQYALCSIEALRGAR